MRVVIDTNVVVSGFISRDGPPGRLVRGVSDGVITPVFDARMLDEYAEVVQRPKIAARIDVAAALAWILMLQHVGLALEQVDAYSGLLPDEGDRPFLEVALASGAVLVTGNAADYPKAAGVEVLTPAEAARRLLEG